MRKVKQTKIKKRTYYFYNDQINLKDFDAKLSKDDEKNYTEIGILLLWSLSKFANCNSINNVNPLYLMINEMIGHVEEKNETSI